MKIKLVIGEDKFIFASLEELFNFLNQYTTEKLIDCNCAELEYFILVEE
jgi:hypothetical protein